MNVDVSLHQMRHRLQEMIHGCHFLLSIWRTGCFLKTVVNNSSDVNVNALTSGLFLREGLSITWLHNVRWASLLPCILLSELSDTDWHHSPGSPTEGWISRIASVMLYVIFMPSDSRYPSSEESSPKPLQLMSRFGFISWPKERSSSPYSESPQSAWRKVKMTRAAFWSIRRFPRSSISAWGRVMRIMLVKQSQTRSNGCTMEGDDCWLHKLIFK